MDKKYSVSSKGITFALDNEICYAGSTLEGEGMRFAVTWTSKLTLVSSLENYFFFKISKHVIDYGFFVVELDFDKLGILPQTLKYGVYGLTFRKIGEEKGQVKQDCEYIFKEEKSEKLPLKKDSGNNNFRTHFFEILSYSFK
jgi:hypothetical protein